MTERRDYRDSPKCRRICFETWKRFDPNILNGRAHMRCQCGNELRPSCNEVIDPGSSKREHAWHADHAIRKYAERRNSDASDVNVPENLRPVRAECDRERKAREDTRRIAKNKRHYDKKYGIRQTKSPMMGSRNHPSGLRKRMNGKVERW